MEKSISISISEFTDARHYFSELSDSDLRESFERQKAGKFSASNYADKSYEFWLVNSAAEAEFCRYNDC